MGIINRTTKNNPTSLCAKIPTSSFNDANWLFQSAGKTFKNSKYVSGRYTKNINHIKITTPITYVILWCLKLIALALRLFSIPSLSAESMIVAS
jgi:hypothetical protein